MNVKVLVTETLELQVGILVMVALVLAEITIEKATVTVVTE